MRILWFTNTASLASNFLKINSQGGGWISSLEQKVAKVDGIKLGIAFHHDSKTNGQFEIEGTSYFLLPTYKAKGKINRWRKRWIHQIEPESDIDYYLRVVNEFEPDIIHIFGTENAYGLIIKHTKIPAIIQIQGNLTAITHKWFSGFSPLKVFRYTNSFQLLKGYGLWHEYYILCKKASREQRIIADCQYFIGRTDWDRRIIRGLSSQGIYYHCDEIIRKDFYSNHWSLNPKSKLSIFTTCNPAIYKGLETILMVASYLKLYFKQNFEWKIAGIGYNDELVGIVEKSLNKDFSENNICFLGSLDSTSLINNMLQANCYIHASHIENSPNSVCEAMLLGMPIIATYAGGTPSIILDKQEGILVQDGDPFVLAGAIIELMENRNFATKLGENARKRALQRHDPEIIIKDLLSIYNNTIKNSLR